MRSLASVMAVVALLAALPVSAQRELLRGSLDIEYRWRDMATYITETAQVDLELEVTRDRAELRVSGPMRSSSIELLPPGAGSPGGPGRSREHASVADHRWSGAASRRADGALRVAFDRTTSTSPATDPDLVWLCRRETLDVGGAREPGMRCEPETPLPWGPGEPAYLRAPVVLSRRGVHATVMLSHGDAAHVELRARR